MPAGHRPVETGRPDVMCKQQQLKAVRKRHLGELGGHRPSQHEVPPLERALELAVGASLRCHEHMFA